jgi:hypothetical protein
MIVAAYSTPRLSPGRCSARIILPPEQRRGPGEPMNRRRREQPGREIFFMEILVALGLYILFVDKPLPTRYKPDCSVHHRVIQGVFRTRENFMNITFNEVGRTAQRTFPFALDVPVCVAIASWKYAPHRF